MTYLPGSPEPAAITAEHSPVAYSTIEQDFVAAQICRRYFVSGRIEAQLLYRGVNDVYVVRCPRGRLAMRIWRAGTRAIAGVVQELDYLDFLHAHAIPVSNSVRTTQGERYITFDAIEGLRPAALYEWAPGVKFGDRLDLVMAERIGAAFADMHLVSKDYVPEDDISDDPVAALHTGLPALLCWVEDRPQDINDYSQLTDTLSRRLETIGSLDLPRGMCHQDMHPSNVHVTPDGTITFLDFDGCARGHWLHDVKNFVFGTAFYGFAECYGVAFERGYLARRPYTRDEIASQELFLLAKAFRLLGAAALGSSSRGRDLLRLRNLDWFASYIKPRAHALGLLLQ